MKKTTLLGLVMIIASQGYCAISLDVQPAADQPPVTVGVMASDGQLANVGAFILISRIGVADDSEAFNLQKMILPMPLVIDGDEFVEGYFADLASPYIPIPTMEGLVAGGLVISPEDKDVKVALIDGDTFEVFESVKIIHEPTCYDVFKEHGFNRQRGAYRKYHNKGYNLDCWCEPYQCDGDIAGDKHILGYRVYTTDLTVLAVSWKAKFGDANLNPCADLDHDGHILGYRVYTTDLDILARNWKKKDADLPGDCPRPAGGNPW